MNDRFVFFLFCWQPLLGSSLRSLPSPFITRISPLSARKCLLDLKSGENRVNVNDITMHLEPDSVILRDPAGKHAFNVLEQNYRADPVSQISLLSLYEGRTLLTLNSPTTPQ